jgi:hypothetical protein
MEFLKTFVRGYGTYIAAALTILHAVSGYLLGYTDATTAVRQVIEGFGLAGLRRAIK